MRPNNIMFRAPGGLEQSLRGRSGGALSIHQTAKRDLLRYYATMFDSRPQLTPHEAGFVAHALRDIRMTEDSYRLIAAAVAERAGDLGKTWKVNTDDVVRRIARLHPAAKMALLDGVERFWLRVADGEEPSPELLKDVGLARNGDA